MHWVCNHLPKYQSKTWNYLLNKDRQHVSSGLDLQSDFDRFVELEEQPDTIAPVSPELPTDSDQATELPGHDQNQLIPPDVTPLETDVFYNPIDPVDETLIRRTRSGKMYFSSLVSSILKIKPNVYQYAYDNEVPILIRDSQSFSSSK